MHIIMCTNRRSVFGVSLITLDDFHTQIKGCHVGNVAFVRVVEPPVAFHSGDYPVSPELLIKSESAYTAAAKEYLDQIINRFRHENAKLHSEVLTGRVADSLSDFIEVNDFDLMF